MYMPRLGFQYFHNSKGILGTTLVGTWFSTYVVIFMASLHKDSERLELLTILLSMRAHGIDDAQLVALFPMSLSGIAQRWFTSIEPSRLCTWEDMAHEFLT